MILRTFAGIAFAALAGTGAAAADAPRPQSTVSVEHAPYHRLVIANQDFALLDNFFPPGSDSGFHLHPRELFYVIVEPAKASTQRPGQALRPLPPIAVGSVGYNVLTAEPFIHRVVNADTRPFHIVAVEIRRPAPRGAAISGRGPETGFAQVFDNPRLRAWRLILAPGQSAPALRQSGPGVRIYVRGGTLNLSRAGRPDQRLVVAKGDFEQVAPGLAPALSNSGDSIIELIDLELK